MGENITPIEKMETESNFFDYSPGGRITYCRLPDTENVKAIRDIVRLAMTKGLYYGCNAAHDHCNSCGHHWIGDDSSETEDTCPECGSSEITKIRRMY